MVCYELLNQFYIFRINKNNTFLFYMNKKQINKKKQNVLKVLFKSRVLLKYQKECND